jgi:catenin beta 1
MEGGIEKMVVLLDRPQEKFLAILTDCLKILSFEHKESKLRILHCGGPAKLVNVMKRFNYEKLLWTTSRVLKVLSVCPQNKPAIVQAGGMQAMTPHLVHPSQRLVKSCLYTLRNLSDAATKEENIRELLLSLTRLLGSSDVDVVTCCVGILSNLTCNNQRNKMTLCSNGVIDALIRTLQSHGQQNEDVAEPCLCALRHLTWRHQDSDASQNAVRIHNGLPVIVHFLQTNRAPLVKAALGVVRNLAQNSANQQPLRQLEAVTHCGNALQSTFAEVRNAQMVHAPIPHYDGVSVLDIVDCATMALQTFAKDEQNRKIILHMNLTQIFAMLLSYESETIQRSSCAVLAELAVDPEGARMIESVGAVAPLTELMHSRNQSIATYASQTLYYIGQDKPDEYRNNLNVEMNSVLNRHDSAPWTQDGLNEMNAMPDEPFNEMMYQQAFEPPIGGMDTNMQVGSPAGPWNPQGPVPGDANMYPGPPAPPPAAHGHGPPPPGGWYDTDL